jgi:IS30 family transposase
MPYTHYTTDERNALQAMESMGLSKSEMAALLGKHPGSVYRKLSRNSTGGVYTGSEDQRAAEQRRLDGKRAPNWAIPC